MLVIETQPQIAEFITKLNRFTVEVRINGMVEKAHLPNSGRLLTVLQPGQPCWVSHVQSPNRKTSYDLLAMEMPEGPVLVDARLPGQVVKAALLQKEIIPLAGYDEVKAEYYYGESRIDFYLQGKAQPPCLLEVKSASDYAASIARFPDAPSKRAQRHLRELIHAVDNGWRGIVLLAAQMPWAECVHLNSAIDPDFVDVARDARSAGVEFLAYAFNPLLPSAIELGRRVPVCF